MSNSPLLSKCVDKFLFEPLVIYLKGNDNLIYDLLL